MWAASLNVRRNDPPPSGHASARTPLAFIACYVVAGVAAPGDTCTDPATGRPLAPAELSTRLCDVLYALAHTAILDPRLKPLRASDQAAAMVYIARRDADVRPLWPADIATLVGTGPAEAGFSAALAALERTLLAPQTSATMPKPPSRAEAPASPNAVADTPSSPPPQAPPLTPSPTPPPQAASVTRAPPVDRGILSLDPAALLGAAMNVLSVTVGGGVSPVGPAAMAADLSPAAPPPHGDAKGDKENVAPEKEAAPRAAGDRGPTPVSVRSMSRCVVCTVHGWNDLSPLLLSHNEPFLLFCLMSSLNGRD